MLVARVVDLEAERERMVNSIKEERRNGKEIERDVVIWLEKVNEVIERAKQIQKDPHASNASYLPTVDGVASASTKGGENYETRESLKGDILKALADFNSINIGVYGLGGVDNIWTMLDLKKVGIPFGNEHNGCKLLMTSRDQDVLLQMDVPWDFTFKLELMSENETWRLFQFMVGDVVKDNDLKDVAIQVAQKCESLPLSNGSAFVEK
ncbi:putative CC-NBS-LRR resistance protein [Trifolium pratense]|uniref:Putative CC-NBS-LRR resistance protein n=1 Tax=Trifolium pratense TaxID=57577 RepID=A0A2K3LMV2_TRIPR|nr:putative CC-NBS-LRR resistance protein [Trifolium pratense]